MAAVRHRHTALLVPSLAVLGGDKAGSCDRHEGKTNRRGLSHLERGSRTQATSVRSPATLVLCILDVMTSPAATPYLISSRSEATTMGCRVSGSSMTKSS